MNSIYNFFTNAFDDLIKEAKKNTFLVPFLFLLITIPTHLGLNNIVLCFFLLVAIWNFKTIKIKFDIAIALPIFLYFWMLASYFWSIDKPKTLEALPIAITLFLLPIVFLFIPYFSLKQKKIILAFYSYSTVIFVVFFILRAIIRYIITKDSRAFFYHGEYDNDFGLVPKVLNAIHVSVFVAISFFYFFQKEVKTKLDYLISLLLFVFVLLLSSKNIIVVFLFLVLIQVLFYSKIANKMRLRNLTIILFIIGIMFSFSSIKNRFILEFYTNTDKGIGHNVSLGQQEGIKNVSIADAWLKEKFHPSDYFPGTAFRVYQTRLFCEFVNEEPIFWSGFGLNASQNKLKDKEIAHNLYPGYGSFNFHNQYIQNFADLGLIGFLLILIILVVNIKNAFKSKDFMHIAFAILMISLFLTESFLSRQRGVVFFTAFYCLFNAKNGISKATNTNK